MFGDFDFSKMNEQDVRESILAPLVRELGYRHSTANTIITEQTLRYPKLSLGRKKPTDPELRGKADYILEAEGRWRWVLEAKSPDVDLAPDDREQAWSYAVHPEVKAIYAVVSNGRQFEVHLTSDGPNAKPVLVFEYGELAGKFQTLHNLLSPDALKGYFPTFVLDTGLPLGVGLRSFAKVVKGSFTYTSATPPTPGMGIVGMNASSDEGAVERSEGQILAYLKLRGNYRQFDEVNRALGLDILNMMSTDAVVSVDPNEPTCSPIR